jgi:hypothetical protein
MILIDCHEINAGGEITKKMIQVSRGSSKKKGLSTDVVHA